MLAHRRMVQNSGQSVCRYGVQQSHTITQVCKHSINHVSSYHVIACLWQDEWSCTMLTVMDSVVHIRSSAASPTRR
jgi:hypothetical protein